MPIKKITQIEETKALEEVISESFLGEKIGLMKYTSLADFFDTAPISIEDKANILEEVLGNLIFRDAFYEYKYQFSSFDIYRQYVLDFNAKYLSFSYEGISLKAQQVRTILSDSGDFEKGSILIFSTLFGILDKDEAKQSFKKLISDESTLEDKYNLAMSSLYANFDFLAQNEYESLMANYDHELANEYAELLIASVICSRTKDWVKKEYFTNVLNHEEDFSQSELLVMQEAQQELFGE